MESVNCSRAPSEEVFQTMLCDAEAMVNSRPLTNVPLETSDQQALTSNYLILLSLNGIKQPERDRVSEGEALRMESVSQPSGSIKGEMDPVISSVRDPTHQMA